MLLNLLAHLLQACDRAKARFDNMNSKCLSKLPHWPDVGLPLRSRLTVNPPQSTTFSTSLLTALKGKAAVAGVANLAGPDCGQARSNRWHANRRRRLFPRPSPAAQGEAPDSHHPLYQSYPPLRATESTLRKFGVFSHLPNAAESMRIVNASIMRNGPSSEVAFGRRKNGSSKSVAGDFRIIAS